MLRLVFLLLLTSQAAQAAHPSLTRRQWCGSAVAAAVAGTLGVAFFRGGPPAEKSVPPPEADPFQTWVAKYARKNPFAAFRATSARPTPEAHYRAALAGESRFTFDPPLRLFGEVGEYSFRGRSPTERDSRMTQVLRETVATNPANRLLVVFAGQDHIFQYYAATLDKNVTYAMYPYGRDSKFERPDWTELSHQLGFRNRADLVGAAPDLPYLTDLDAIVSARAVGIRYTPEDVFASEIPTQANVVLIGDLHAIRDESLAESFPGSETWAAKGIDSVLFLCEDYDKVQASSRKMVDQLNKTPGSVRSTQSRIVARELANDPFWHLPELSALLKKMRTFESKMKVEYRPF